MNLHEYQANEILSRFSVPTAKGIIANTVDEALSAAKKLNNGPWVVKAQIHAGGRGKGGGVKLAKTLNEVSTYATNILGMTLVTKQTGPKGKLVRKVFIQQGCKIVREFYLSMLVDRTKGKIAIVSSAEGGMNIEEVAATNPEKINTTLIDPITGIMPFHARDVIKGLGLDSSYFTKGQAFIFAMYEAFTKCDASLIEINPLILDGDNNLVALDAKVSLDDNAIAKHEDLLELRDINEEDPRETEAIDADLSYIALEGAIGCMVNGAGLVKGIYSLHIGTDSAGILKEIQKSPNRFFRHFT